MASDLPFNCLLNLIVVNLVQFCIIWMNAFPIKNDFSKEFSPRSIMVRTKLSCKKHFRIKFGDYAKVHTYPDPRNNLTPRELTQQFQLVTLVILMVLSSLFW